MALVLFGLTLRDCYPEGADLEPPGPCSCFCRLCFYQAKLPVLESGSSIWAKHFLFSPATNSRLEASTLFFFPPTLVSVRHHFTALLTWKNQKGRDTTKHDSQQFCGDMSGLEGLVQVFCQEYLWACNRVSSQESSSTW